jgi:hypothetical protein
MNTNILASAELSSIQGILVVILMLLIYVGLFVLIVSLMIRLVRYLGSAGKEQKLIRMEIGKLAEEVHLLRQKFENENKDNP